MAVGGASNEHMIRSSAIGLCAQAYVKKALLKTGQP
jgi:hypothetical protein